MKKIIITTLMLSMGILKEAHGQVGIGKSELSNASVLLEFGEENKGIILPSVDNLPEDAVGGTLLFDISSKSVKVLEEKNQGVDSSWTNLTENEESEGVQHSYLNASGDVGEGVVIGAESTEKPGILVLESTTKAMVLPKVASPHLNMPGSIAGTMVYDTDADMIAVYDGVNWSYWK